MTAVARPLPMPGPRDPAPVTIATFPATRPLTPSRASSCSYRGAFDKPPHRLRNPILAGDHGVLERLAERYREIGPANQCRGSFYVVDGARALLRRAIG